MSLWQIWWLALAIKIILLPILPITPDETYYFAWARHLSLSYYDHPPFIAWIMMIGLPLWKTALGIRVPGVILGHLALIPWFLILGKLNFSKRAQLFWMLAVLLGPLTGLGGFIITPDVPLTFFWSLSLLALLKVFENSTIKNWAVLGGLFGLGLLSKYVMILFLPAALIAMGFENKFSELKRPGFYIAALITLIVFSPVLIWNFQNDFASFLFQTKHGLSGSEFNWGLPFEYIGSQFGLLNPFLAAVGLWVMFHSPHRNRLLLIFCLVPFAFFFMTSFRARVEANWPVCGYPAFMALVASVVDHELECRKWLPWIKRGFYISALFMTMVISHTIHPWLPLPKNKDHTEITREWLADVEAAKDIRPLFARTYQMAAFHSYYRSAEDEVYKMAGLDRTDAYDFIKEARPNSKSYIILTQHDKLPPVWNSQFELKFYKTLPSLLVVYELIPRNGI